MGWEAGVGGWAGGGECLCGVGWEAGVGGWAGGGECLCGVGWEAGVGGWAGGGECLCGVGWEAGVGGWAGGGECLCGVGWEAGVGGWAGGGECLCGGGCWIFIFCLFLPAWRKYVFSYPGTRVLPSAGFSTCFFMHELKKKKMKCFLLPRNKGSTFSWIFYLFLHAWKRNVFSPTHEQGFYLQLGFLLVSSCMKTKCVFFYPGTRVLPSAGVPAVSADGEEPGWEARVLPEAHSGGESVHAAQPG